MKAIKYAIHAICVISASIIASNIFFRPFDMASIPLAVICFGYLGVVLYVNFFRNNRKGKNANSSSNR